MRSSSCTRAFALFCFAFTLPLVATLVPTMSTATLLLLLLGLFSFASCVNNLALEWCRNKIPMCLCLQNTHTVNSPLAIQQASDQENVLNSNTANPTLPDIWEVRSEYRAYPYKTFVQSIIRQKNIEPWPVSSRLSRNWK